MQLSQIYQGDCNELIKKLDDNSVVNFARDTYSNKLSILQDFVFSTACMTRGYAIKNRPTLPF